LNLAEPIDRMEAIVVASVRAVRVIAAGADLASGQVEPNHSATAQIQSFAAPPESVSAGLLY
jgi:hypothetical protein